MTRKDTGPKADPAGFSPESSPRGPRLRWAGALGRPRGAGAKRTQGAFGASTLGQGRRGRDRDAARARARQRHSGSDFMVDVIKTLDIKYRRRLRFQLPRHHESLINYGGNRMPEFLTCMHEESAVGMAHGYFKVAGKPLMTLCHGTVGLQHASMASTTRVRPRAGDRRRRQRHGRRAPAAGRADLPLRAGHQRAGARLTSGRHAGVAAAFLAVVRARVQDRDDAALRAGGDLARRGAAAGADEGTRRREALYPRYVPTAPPQGDTGAVKEAARLLAAAQNPVIVATARRARRAE